VIYLLFNKCYLCVVVLKYTKLNITHKNDTIGHEYTNLIFKFIVWYSETVGYFNRPFVMDS